MYSMCPVHNAITCHVGNAKWATLSHGSNIYVGQRGICVTQRTGRKMIPQWMIGCLFSTFNCFKIQVQVVAKEWSVEDQHEKCQPQGSIQCSPWTRILEDRMLISVGASMEHGQPGTAHPRSSSVYDVDDAPLPLWLYCYLEIPVGATWLTIPLVLYRA